MVRLRQETEPDEAGLDGEALDRLDRHFAREVDEGRLPGFLVAVARRGRVAHLTTYGHRDVAAGLPVEADTLFRIYSMTKPVTAVAALMLVEEGLLSLDDPVARYLPAFAEPRVYAGGTAPDITTRPARGPVLVRHLMTHTAGLTFGFYHAHPVDALYRAAGLESSVRPGDDLAATVDLYASLPLQFEPGTEWNYSVASNVLGRLVEVVSGRPLDAFFAERIFGPLGMTDAGFQVSDEQLPRLAELYGEQDGGGIAPIPGLPLRGRPRLLSGSGGLVASAHDVHRFAELLRRRGELDGVRLLAPATVDLMTRNHLPGGADLRAAGSRPAHDVPGNDGVGFGLGVSVVTDPSRTQVPSGPGTFGWNGVATTTFWVDPGRELTVQLLTQVRPKGSHTVFPDLKRLVHAAVIG
ncbi:serine hydrolase domain-containing protein [Streptomyces griseoviridis]|jgi:CubicO group peptidase (beta-lactamase class C family)|uniref:CubicO group peptidase (Beta-lactamase class C family) n=3 Tax=Streptomyces TaxID=1883 RepID=A0ABT9LP90_STRGD|nr:MULTISPECIES: serine hydrolase domain-containing protein [Streptomyces]MDP9685356.1 CubicO group peptidase (beta-lactamase class C family) [Streptomyces griseoviridis]GGS40990.1 serine hydrolase [Streptomyces niveoruber]GGS96741.1 serine hydrolase [Streptomyces griseoviridis]GGU31194.1 serine hydrolase [Streptomyces daghestanicus]GHI32932.1 serine hydrolase [Streptomyces daghestanicus]